MPIKQDTNQKVKGLHATLTAAVKQIDNDLKADMEKAKKKASDAVKPLIDSIDDYWLELNAGVDVEWKFKILADAKERSDKALAKVGTKEDEQMNAASEALSELDNALGWIVAKPVDEKVIAETIKMDKAAEAAEKLKG
jgi:hypothetical protein